jgi:plastocyanin
VKKGTTVHWMNNDDEPHTVNSTNNNTLNSGTIGVSGSYSYTFNNTGIYQYHCNIHPEMTGTVIVTN